MSDRPTPKVSLRVETVPIDSVVPDPANARVHDEKNLDVIKGSLARFGQQKPIVVGMDNVIRAGNGTWRAAKALGWTEIAVVRTDLRGSEAAAFAIADNRSTDLSSFDLDVLEAQISGLVEDGWSGEDLARLSISDDDLREMAEHQELLGESEGNGSGEGGPREVVEDEAPPVQEKVVTRKGDIWLLGAYYQCECGEIHELP